jgi:hypothetical protein
VVRSSGELAHWVQAVRVGKPARSSPSSAMEATAHLVRLLATGSFGITESSQLNQSGSTGCDVKLPASKSIFTLKLLQYKDMTL